MTAPTFVSATSTSFALTTTPQTVTISVQAGDLIVVCAASEDNGAPLQTPTATGNTFAVAQQVAVANYCQAGVWTATAAATNASLVVSQAVTGGLGLHFGLSVSVWRNHGGVGASAKTNVASGAPSLAITTTGANSGLVTVNADWTATSGASRVWRTINVAATEDAYANPSGAYTAYVAHYTDAGAAGAQTAGLTAPTGQKYSIVALEILGTSSSAFSANAALAGSGSLSASMKPAVGTTAALAGSGSLGVIATPAVSAAAALSGSGSLGASGTVLANAALSGSGALSVAQVLAVATTATLAGAGSLAVLAVPAEFATAGLSGSGLLTVSSQVPAIAASVGLAGAGTLTVAQTLAVAASVALSGAGSLSASGGGNAFTTSASLAGVGVLSASVLPGFVGVASLSGVGSLTVTSLLQALAVAALSGSGVLSVQIGIVSRGRFTATASLLWVVDASSTVWLASAAQLWKVDANA